MNQLKEDWSWWMKWSGQQEKINETEISVINYANWRLNDTWLANWMTAFPQAEWIKLLRNKLKPIPESISSLFLFEWIRNQTEDIQFISFIKPSCIDLPELWLQKYYNSKLIKQPLNQSSNIYLLISSYELCGSLYKLTVRPSFYFR